MEPLLMILVPGFFGGLVLALLIARNRQGTPATFVPRRLAAPSPALINMANIQIEGVGGLGMVAAVVTVAAFDSRIRLATLLAAALGLALALALIAMRRRSGAMPSGGDGPDDRSMLHLEAGWPPAQHAEVPETTGRLERAGGLTVLTPADA